MVKSNYLVINSKHRTSLNDSTSKFSYSIGESLEIQGYAVKSLSIPNVAVNINKYNNELNFLVNGFPRFITVPPAQYRTSTLIVALQAQLDLSGIVYVVSQDPKSQHITISGSVMTSWKTGGLGTKLGFTKNTVSQLSNTAQGLPQLMGTYNYFVGCVELVQGFNGLLKGGERLPLFGDVNNNVPYGEIIHYEAQDFNLNVKSYERVQNIQHLNFIIYDDDLNVVDLMGLDVEFVIKIYEAGAKELK